MVALSTNLHWRCRIFMGCILAASTRKVSAFLVTFAHSSRAWPSLHINAMLTEHGKICRHMSNQPTPTGSETAVSQNSSSSSMGGELSAPCYRRLYEAAMKELEREMTLETYPIPEGLGHKSATIGKGRNKKHVNTTITAFRAPKFRQIRAALVESDGPTQVLNFVIFPDLRYELPIFGADVVSLPGVQLVCIDLQPSYASQVVDQRTGALLEEIRRRHSQAFPWGGELPAAARRFLSPYCLWSKIGSDEAIEEKVQSAMLEYLKVYLALAAESTAEAEDSPLIPDLCSGQAEYCKYRRDNDPARGMLTRFYGSEWTEAAIEGILFDYNGGVS